MIVLTLVAFCILLVSIVILLVIVTPPSRTQKITAALDSIETSTENTSRRVLHLCNVLDRLETTIANAIEANAKF